MAKSQKIKLEHLDQTLIDWIEHALHSGMIRFADLDADLQNAITNANHGTSSYNDTPVRNELQNLNNKKLSKDEARSDYHRKDTPLTIDDMNENIKELLRSVQGVNTAFKRGLRLSDTPITMTDLDGSVQNLINNNEQRLSRLEAVKATIDNAIVALTNTSGDANNSLVALGTSVNNLKSELSTLKINLQTASDSVTSHTSKINTLEQTTAALKNRLDASGNSVELVNGRIPSRFLPESIPTKVDMLGLENRINGIINKSNPINGLNGMMGFISNSDINRTGELRGGNLFIAGVFATTLEELTDFKSKKMPVIISIFDDKIYVTTSFIRDNLISVTNAEGKTKLYGNYAIYSLIEITNELADGQVHSTNPDPDLAEAEDETNFFTFDYTSGGPVTTHWGLNQKFFLDIKTGYILFNDNGAFINLITGDVNYKTLKATPTIHTIVEATKAKANGMALFTSNAYSASNRPTEVPVANNEVKFIETEIALGATYTYESLGTKYIAAEVLVQDDVTTSPTYKKYLENDAAITKAIYKNAANKQCIDIINKTTDKIKVLIQIYSEV
jgi:hypothetical protein